MGNQEDIAVKFYLASGLENKAIVQYVRDRLVAAGHIHTYDWTLNSRATTKEALRQIGIAEKEAVAASDVVIVLLPGGKGTYTEFGMALALEKPIYLYSEQPISLANAATFYFVDGVAHVDGEIDSFIDQLLDVYQ